MKKQGRIPILLPKKTAAGKQKLPGGCFSFPRIFSEEGKTYLFTSI